MNSTIDQKLCKQCKMCLTVCPCNIITMNDQKKVYFIPERLSICQHCGQCMAICETKAITIDGLSYDIELIDLPENPVDYSSFIDFLANRRSVRNFKDEAVPGELLDAILEAISYAPYGASPEKMKITVVYERKIIESALPHIEKFLDKVTSWMENPVSSYMIKRKNSREKFNTIKHHLYPIAKLGNYKLEFGDRITRNAPAMFIMHADKNAEEHTNNSMIYATYMMLAAHSLGLGATITGIVPPAINKVKELKEIFQIPETDEAIISLIVGYPKIKYKRAIQRKVQRIEWLG